MSSWASQETTIDINGNSKYNMDLGFSFRKNSYVKKSSSDSTKYNLCFTQEIKWVWECVNSLKLLFSPVFLIRLSIWIAIYN